MTTKLRRGQAIKLSDQRHAVALKWDRSGAAIDLDLQAVVVDKRGVIVNAVYYNNLEALDRSVMHTGDQQTGESAGYDEMIWVKLSRLPANVQLIIFVVGAYSGGHLRDVVDGEVCIVGQYQGQMLATFKLEESSGDVDSVGYIRRVATGWEFVNSQEVAVQGRHFMDILEPTLRDLIRREIPSAPLRQKVEFPVVKGSSVDLPSASANRRVYVGVSWGLEPDLAAHLPSLNADDTADSEARAERGELVKKTTDTSGIDLDVSAVFFHGDGKEMGAVFFDNTHMFGVHHTGDNLTGEGDGDDETITVNLTQVPQQVAQIFFVVNIYTKDVDFTFLSDASCRVLDSAGSELARFGLGKGATCESGQCGLIISRMYRTTVFDRWAFQALGQFCYGRTWMDESCMKVMKELFALSSYQQVQQYQQATEIHRPGRRLGTTQIMAKERVPGDRERERRHRTPKAHKEPSPKDEEHAFRRANSNESTASSADWLDLTYTKGSFLVGIGWDLLPSAWRGCDLDVSAVFFHQDGRDLGAVCYENMEDLGCTHSGDNRTGEGDGDDEVIQVDLKAVPDEVSQIFFLVNIYSKGMSFDKVMNAHCRLVNRKGKELVRHELQGMRSGSEMTGLIIAQLFRGRNHAWSYKANGAFCKGRCWMDPACIAEMKRQFERTVLELGLKKAEEEQTTDQAVIERDISRLRLTSCEDALKAPPGTRMIVSL